MYLRLSKRSTQNLLRLRCVVIVTLAVVSLLRLQLRSACSYTAKYVALMRLSIAFMTCYGTT
jgi:hypothetical protein